MTAILLSLILFDVEIFLLPSRRSSILYNAYIVYHLNCQIISADVGVDIQTTLGSVDGLFVFCYLACCWELVLRKTPLNLKVLNIKISLPFFVNINSGYNNWTSKVV